MVARSPFWAAAPASVVTFAPLGRLSGNYPRGFVERFWWLGSGILTLVSVRLDKSLPFCRKIYKPVSKLAIQVGSPMPYFRHTIESPTLSPNFALARRLTRVGRFFGRARLVRVPGRGRERDIGRE